jgi:hypothetical protein
MQVLVGLNCGCMVAILPKRSLAVFTLIVFLRRAAGDQLHALSDDVGSRVVDQEMNVIRCHGIIQDTQTETFLRFENPMQVTAPIARSEKSGILSVSLLNVLNGAKRLNDWNVLNKFLGNSGE